MRRDRDKEKSKKKKGGGVLVYVRNDIGIGDMSRVATRDAESIAFGVKGADKRVIVIYRRPGTVLSRELAEAIDAEMAKRGEKVLIGDLNMNMWEDIPQPRVLRMKLAKQYGLEQWVRFATRHPGTEGETG